MLAQPQLPQLVRRKLLEYVEQKSSGVYGHSPQQARRFASGLAGCGGTAVAGKQADTPLGQVHPPWVL
jgi:hypothetical protein